MLLKWTLPKLHAHLLSLCLTPDIWVAQWFITLFAYSLPINLCVNVWSYVYYDGWPAMYRIALALLLSLEKTFLASDLEGIGLLMREWRKEGSPRSNKKEKEKESTRGNGLGSGLDNEVQREGESESEGEGEGVFSAFAQRPAELLRQANIMLISHEVLQQLQVLSSTYPLLL